MSDSLDGSAREPIERLAEVFVERLRAGERPAVSDFVLAHPELADQIRALFPTLLLMEQARPDAPPVGAPARLGEYRLLRELGRGGMGIVYQAEQVALGRHVALKILNGAAQPQPQQLARFQREARAAACLHHTNIVPVYGVGSDGDTHFYVMQYIAGMGLDRVLSELRRSTSRATAIEEVARSLLGSPVPAPAPSPRAYWESVARIGAQVAEALQHAHHQGVVHRDIKPSNLLLDAQGTVWVTDFGLARTQDSEALTSTGDIVGTLRYLAPERFAGQDGDARGDLYALGLTLYELLALRPAFDAGERHQLVRQVTEAAPPPLRQLVPHLPRDLDTIVQKAIERTPAGRYASGEELAADLRRFLEDRPILARRPSALERLGRWCRRNPVVASLSGVVFAALVAVAVVSTVFALHVVASRDAALESADRQAHLLGQQFTANGLRLLDVGDYAGAALWFVEALAQDGNHPERAGFYRTRLSNTLRACPRPLHVWFHDSQISESIYRHDGRVVAVSAGSTVHVWDTSTGLAAVAPLRHDHPVVRCRFSTDGSRLATLCAAAEPASEEEANVTVRFARVWDAATGAPLTPSLRITLRNTALRNRAPVPGASVVSANADRVAVSDDARSFAVWDVATNKLLRPPNSLPETDSSLTDLRLRPDGLQVLTLATEGESKWKKGSVYTHRQTLTLWDASSLAAVTEQRGGLLTRSIEYSEDSLCLRTWQRSGVVVYETAQGTIVWKNIPKASSPYAVSLGCFSLDGRFALRSLSSSDNRLRDRSGLHPTELLDGKTGEAIPGATLDRTVQLAEFSADSRLLLTLDQNAVRVWESKGLTPLGPRIRHGIPSIAHHRFGRSLSPDGRTMLVIENSDPSAVRVHDVQTGESLTPLLKHGEPIDFAEFSPDGASLLTRSHSTIRVWPLLLPPQGHLLQGSYRQRSPDGTQLVIGRKDASELHSVGGSEPIVLSVPEPKSDQERSRFSGVRYVFSEDGRMVMERGSSQATPEQPGFTQFLLWDTANGKLTAVIRERGNVQAYFSLRRSEILVLNYQQEMRRYDLHGTALSPWTALPKPPPKTETQPRPFLPQFSPDGRHFFHLTAPILIDAETGAAALTLAPDKRQNTAGYGLIAFSPDGRRVLDRAGDGSFRVWDARTGQPVTAVLRFAASGDLEPFPPGRFQEGAFSPDGSRVIGLRSIPGRNKGGRACLWDAFTGKALTPLLRAEEETTSVAFSSDGRRVLTASDEGIVRVWDVATGNLVSTLSPRLPGVPSARANQDEACIARFSNDGRRVLTLHHSIPRGSADEDSPRHRALEACLWETATGRPLMPRLPLQPVLTDNVVLGLRGEQNRFDPEGHSFVRLRPDGLEELTNLTADDRTLAAARQLAQVLSGRHILHGSEMVALDEAQLRTQWNAEREHVWPGPRSLLEAQSWHRREVEALGHQSERLATQTFSLGTVANRLRWNAYEWHLTRLLEAAPRDLDARHLRAVLYTGLGRWKEALADRDAALAAGADTWIERGHVRSLLGRWRDAEDDFQQAARHPARAGQALTALALARLQQDNHAGYRDACEQLVKAGPRDLETLVRQGAITALVAAPNALKDWTFLDRLPPEQIQRYPVDLAALLYRRGGHDAEALRLLTLKARTAGLAGSAEHWFVHALVQQRLKESAKQALTKGREQLTRMKTTTSRNNLERWLERLCAEALEREAAKQIEGK